MKTVCAIGLAGRLFVCSVNASADQVVSVSSPSTITDSASQTRSEGVAADPQNGRGAEDSANPALSRVGIAVKVSSLGVGFDVATPVHRRANVRVGFNIFSYRDDFNFHGIDYQGPLKFRSLETHADWFVFAGGFHISPGVMLYNGDRAELNAAVPEAEPLRWGTRAI